MTGRRRPRLRIARQSVERLRGRLRRELRRVRGRNLASVIEELSPVLRGWVAYFRLAETESSFKHLDQWLRRHLRCVIWRQWKTPAARIRELCERGVNPRRAHAAGYSGRGPWWNADAYAMKLAVPNAYFARMGLVSLLAEHRRYRRLR